jgi:hypothetical protein
MPSLNPPLTKDDFINSRWQDVINSSERKECLAYNMAFWEKAQEAKEAGNVREQAVFEILAAVTVLQSSRSQTRNFSLKFSKILQTNIWTFLPKLLLISQMLNFRHELQIFCGSDGVTIEWLNLQLLPTYNLLQN